MPFAGQVGLTYSRFDVTGEIGLEPTNEGKWSSGLIFHNDEFFIFTTIGELNDPPFRYEVYWDGEHLNWPTTNAGHLQQRRIVQLLANEFPIHVFYRHGDTSDFVYAGVGVPLQTNGERPVRVLWAFPRGLRNNALRGQLSARGFTFSAPTRYVQLATLGTLKIYIKTNTSEYPIVLPPYFEGNLTELVAIDGVRKAPADLYYHNSGMREFPTRIHTGRNRIGFGLAISVAGDEALARFLNKVLELTPSTGSAQKVRRDAYKQSDVDPRTETEAKRAARLGQSGFRADLLLRYNQTCAATGVDMPEILRASHIKPWFAADPKERLDPYNGLLLSVHLDLLFDRGLITFEDDGRVRFSRALKQSVIQAYGLETELKLTKIFPESLKYLDYHRRHVFECAINGGPPLIF